MRDAAGGLVPEDPESAPASERPADDGPPGGGPADGAEPAGEDGASRGEGEGGAAPEPGYPLFDWLAGRWSLTGQLLERQGWLPATLAANFETPLTRDNPLEALVLDISLLDPRPVGINAVGPERRAPGAPGAAG